MELKQFETILYDMYQMDFLFSSINVQVEVRLRKGELFAVGY